MPLDDIVVVSDLHMGRGINPESRRFYALEAFFYDDDFLSFCGFLCRAAAERGRPFTLVLNGDTFDLLRIDAVPAAEDGPQTASERRFGPVSTPSQAAATVAQILAGHPGFRAGLAQVLNAGNKVVLLPGNHDIELQWQPVQQVIGEALAAEVLARYGETAAEGACSLLQFHPWFYHEPQRVWIEHGCQYDPENSFRYLLRGGLVQLPDAIVETEHDLPLGNFFQRYLFNFFGNITFIVPSSRANLRYVKWLLLHQPRLLLRVIVSHGPFLFAVLRRLARAQKTARRALAEVHERALAELAATAPAGPRLLAIDALKEVRANAVSAVRTLALQVMRALAIGGGILMAAALTWLGASQVLSRLRLPFGLKATLFVVLTLAVFLGLAGALVYNLLASPQDGALRPLRGAAERIAGLLEVPLVCFGHSHDEQLCRLQAGPGREPAWYGNTGTWIAVFTHDVLLPRERVQYTFLRVQGHTAELLHWSPGRGQAMPVVLLDESDARP